MAIPFFLSGPIGGWLADKFNTKKVLINSELFVGMLYLLTFIFFINNLLDIYILIIIGMLSNIARSFFQPNFQSLIFRIFSKKNLVKVNSIVHVTIETTGVVGPLLTTTIIIFLGKGVVIILCSALYFISAVILLFLRYVHTSANDISSFSIKNIYVEIISSLQNMLNNNKALFYVIIGSSICILFTGALISNALPIFTVKLTGSESHVGYVMATIALGTILG